MSNIPDTRLGQEVVGITEYAMVPGTIESTSDDGRQFIFVTEDIEYDEDGETPIRTTKTISFTPPVKVAQKRFALNLG